MIDDMTKCGRCKNYMPGLHDASPCMANMPQFSLEKDVECENFKSMYIEYPLTIEGIENKFCDPIIRASECGSLVKVAPCGEEYGGKTYLGILLGYMTIDANISYNTETKNLLVSPSHNPAIFVPELKKIIWGCGSWWGKIKNEEDIKQITSEDIENVWYVKMLKEMI